MWTVIEMQNGSIGEHSWAYETKAQAEVKLYQTLAEVVTSPVAVHTVMLVAEDGTVHECRCYRHGEVA